MRSLRALPVMTVLVLAWLAVLAPPASAHALLERSYPAAGSALPRSPHAMLLYFTEAPDPSLSTVSLLNSAGRAVPGVGKPAVAAGNAEELRTALPRLTDGVYTVNWRTVSKVDGHITNGSFAFGIGVQPPWPRPRTARQRAPARLRPQLSAGGCCTGAWPCSLPPGPREPLCWAGDYRAGRGW